MKVEFKGYEIWLGADLGTDNYTLNIPKIKIFKTYNIKKNPIATLEQKAHEIINQHELRTISKK